MEPEKESYIDFLKKQMANIYNPEVVIADAIIKNRKDE
jgi:hypothetical protein